MQVIIKSGQLFRHNLKASSGLILTFLDATLVFCAMTQFSYSQLHESDCFFNANFEDVSHLVLVFPWLPWNM